MGMRFQPFKCNIMQITMKRIKKFKASCLEGTVLDNVENIKYLGITNDLRWNTHRTLDFLRRNFISACPQDVKESAYKGLVRPVLEFGTSSILFQMHLRRYRKGQLDL